MPFSSRSHAQTIQVLAVVAHFLGFTQLEIVEMARGPAVGDMDEQELGARKAGEGAYVLHDRAVGRRVLDSDEDALVHVLERLVTARPRLARAATR